MSQFFVTLQNGTILEASKSDILFPYFGNWTAYVMFAEAQVAPSGICEVSCLDKKLAGYILPTHSQDAEGRFYCVIIGGNGGLSNISNHYSYNYQIPIRNIITQLLSSQGEILSNNSSQDLLNTLLPSWHTFSESLSLQISTLVDYIGGVWRVLQDGTIYLGMDLFEEINNFEYTVIKENPIYASATLFVNTLSILPGLRFPISEYPHLSQRKIGACKYFFDEGSVKIRVWFLEESNYYTDRLHQGLESFIKEVMRNVDYMKSYSCRVVLQRADGSIDVEPDDPNVPPMTSVPQRVFIGGVKYQVKENERGNLIFENGDPRKPSFSLYEMGNGGKKIARVDDEVGSGTLQFLTVANGVLTGVYKNGKGISTPFSLGDIIPISGLIKTGWPRLEVGDEK